MAKLILFKALVLQIFIQTVIAQYIQYGTIGPTQPSPRSIFTYQHQTIPNAISLSDSPRSKLPPSPPPYFTRLSTSAANLPSESLYSPKLSSSVSSLPTFETSKLSGIDGTVLNNLAIALQLLLLNNMLNIPQTNAIESKSLASAFLPPTDKTFNCLPQDFNEAVFLNRDDRYEPSQIMPDTKFLTSSSLIDPCAILKSMMESLPGVGAFGTSFKASPRGGFNLVSPYEAIKGTSNPYIPSRPTWSKKDLKSPYSAIIAADNFRDLFSISDF